MRRLAGLTLSLLAVCAEGRALAAPATAQAPQAAPPVVEAQPPGPAPAKPAEAPAATSAPPAAPTARPGPDLRPEVRIQRRFVEQRRRFAAFAGFAWLERGDFYYSPGLEVAASYYALEWLAVDVRAAFYFSAPTPELVDVVNRTGLVPDSRPSVFSLMAGARYALGYAKAMLSPRLVLHFEPQLFLYGGLHVASGQFEGVVVGPMGEVGLGFLIFATPRVQVRLDAGLTVGAEQRTKWVAVVGALPVVSAGVLF